VDVFVGDWSFFMHVDELDQDNLIVDLLYLL
jgi:hypothetical protein